VYLAAGAVAEYVRTRANIPNVTMTAQTSGGFVENLRLTARGETDFGFTGSTMLYEALHAAGAFSRESPAPYRDVRAVFPSWVAATHWLTYRADINTLYDLRGRRVNLGPPGSAAADYGELTLKAAGLWDAVRKEYVGWSDGVRLMGDGILDAVTLTGPYPFPAAQEAAASPGRHLRFVAIPEEVRRNARKINPSVVFTQIPPDVYGRGIPGGVYPSVGYFAYLIVHKRVPEWAVYEITKAVLSEDGKRFLLNSYSGFRTGFDSFPGFGPLLDVGVPLHPGAVRYWKEQRYGVPAVLIPADR